MLCYIDHYNGISTSGFYKFNDYIAKQTNLQENFPNKIKVMLQDLTRDLKKIFGTFLIIEVRNDRDYFHILSPQCIHIDCFA